MRKPIVVTVLLLSPISAHSQNNFSTDLNNSLQNNEFNNIEFNNIEFNNNETYNNESNETLNNDSFNNEYNTENNSNNFNNPNIENNDEINGNIFGGDQTAFGSNPLNNLNEYNNEEGFNLEGEGNLFETNSGGVNTPIFDNPIPQSQDNPSLSASPPALNLTPGESSAAPISQPSQESEAPPIDFFQDLGSSPALDSTSFNSQLGTSGLDQPSSSSNSLPALDDFSSPGVTETDWAQTAGAPIQQEPKGPDGLTDSERELVKQRMSELQPLPRGTYPEEYIIQPGDTLWDISDQLLNDPFWWPKLWSFNPSITNPHLIEPGMRIIFEPSDGFLPPSLALSDEGSFLSASVINSTFKVEQNPAAETWKELSGTLITEPEIAEFIPIEISEARGLNAKSFVTLPGEILGNTPPTLARVSDLQSQHLTLLRGQTVYTEPSWNFAPKPGDRFLAARPAGDLLDASDGIPSRADLWIYTGVLAAVKTEPSRRTRLTVEDSLHGVLPGDRIIPYSEVFVEAYFERDLSKPSSRAEAVVAAIGDGTKSIASHLDVVHLVDLPGTRTSLASLQEGDSLEVLSPPAGAFISDDDVEYIPAGQVEILTIRGQTATALVTRVEHEIMVGSRTGPAFID